MKKYRKKPIIIEAIQITNEMFQCVEGRIAEVVYHSHYKGNYVKIKTLEGIMIGRVGDWIIRGVNGELYPCKPDIFEKTYEPVKTRGAF